MARKKQNPEGEHLFNARIPLEIWAQLEASATANQRSLNGELIWVLRQHYGTQQSATTERGPRSAR